MTGSNDALHRINLREQLSQRLEQMILAHEFPPGATLPSERELAERWGVSRAVVRDAVRTLESKGLVKVHQGVGAVVTSDVREAFAKALELLIERGRYALSELMRLRMALEAEAAGLAAQFATQDDLDAMDQILQQHEQAIAEGNYERVVETDRAFHLRVLEATYSRPMIDLIAPLVRCFMAKTLFLTPRQRPTFKDCVQHREVYNRIKAGDVEGAARQMRISLVDGWETLQELERAGASPNKAA